MDTTPQLLISFDGSDEYEHTEDKATLSEEKSAIATLAGFATARGGTVRFGYLPDGTRCGVQIGKGTIEALANNIKTNTNPPQFPSIVVDMGVPDKLVILVTVEESPVKPVWAYNKPVKRVGRSTQTLSPEETYRLRNLTVGRTWDTLPCQGFNLADVDRERVESYLLRSGLDARSATEPVLENLGLLDNGTPSKAAVLLFARNPQRYFPDAQVKCARFVGDSSVHFADERTLDDDILTQIEDALAFVTRNIGQRIRITGKAQREVVPDYPMDAVREAVANAVCHRDYAATGTVQVRIYNKRLEVWNPGMLSPELTIEDLYREHPSKPRNPRLANALHRANVVEKWGTGTLRIVEACKQAGLPRPEFISEMGDFKVKFQNPRPGSSVLNVVAPTARQRRALALLAPGQRITTGEYARAFDVGERTAQRDLSKLASLGFLTRAGKGQSTSFIRSSKSLKEVS